MADHYVYSGAAGAGTGADWTDAFTTLAAACAAGSAGDRFFVADDHAETQASAMTIPCPGTLASPCLILCVDRGGSVPPVSADRTNTATISTTGSNNITVSGIFYANGIKLTAGNAANAANLRLSSGSRARQVYEDCELILGNSNGNSNMELPQTLGARVELVNTRIKFGAVNQYVLCGSGNGGAVVARGGGIVSGSATPAYMFYDDVGVANILMDGFDFSNFAATVNLVRGGTGGDPGRKVFRNCKLPASWSGSVLSTTPSVIGSRGEMYNCDAADTNYKLLVVDPYGSVRDETTLVKTGGASDGDTPIAWKMASSANAEYPINVLRSPEIFSERIAGGASKTITVDILHDSATNLQDDEVWLEVQYLGTSGTPLALFVSDAVADPLATPADQDGSAATWTTTGMSNPNEQKLSVTFTPQEKGVAIVTVCVAKASYTVYVDPVAQVS